MSTEQGAQRRARRHDVIVAAAKELVGTRGLEGFTMQALADRVECAVGTIYTYFPSKSSLLAELMGDAVRLLLDTYRTAAAGWERQLESLSADVAAIARILAFTDLFVESQVLHPDEFRFLQLLITTPESLIDPTDVPSVLPPSLEFLGEVHGLIEGAVRAGALSPARHDDDTLRRTLRWTGAVHGALLVSNVAQVSGLPRADAYDARVLARSVTADLLAAWGVAPSVLTAAGATSSGLTEVDLTPLTDPVTTT